MTDLASIKSLSVAGRHQECLQACQNALQANPEEAYAYKYTGLSLIALGQLEKAKQCLLKAHQLDCSDPEIAKDIGNTYLHHGNANTALEWYKKSLEIKNNYAPAFNNIANLKRQSGDTQEAIDLFKQAIQADPKLIQAYVGAAASFLALGDIDQAESFGHQALAINERTPGMNEILGIVFQHRSNPEQAIEYYQKELEINPNARNSLLNLGLSLLQKEQTAAAVASLVKASALAPSEECSLLLAQAYQNLGHFKEATIEYYKLDINRTKNKMIPYNLGLCQLNTGNNNDAIKSFKLAIQLDETFIAAWGNKGNALINEGRYHEALPVLLKVHDLVPDHPDAHMKLGLIYKELGLLDQALESTLKSLSLKPDNPDAHMNQGLIYKELGQLDQALESTLKSLDLKPDNPDALVNLGGIYKELGLLDQALTATLKSIDLKADQTEAHLNLGAIHKDLHELDQALASTLKSLELKPHSPDALLNLGGIYKELGEIDQALDSTLKSLELKPDNPDALVNLGGIYKELGQLDHALDSTLKGLELKPNNPTGQINLGGIYRELGQLDHALACTLMSLELKPDNPIAQINLGGIYQDLGQLENAIVCLKEAIRSEKTNEKAAIQLAQVYLLMGKYRDGVQAISGIDSKESGNLLLSLYLCLNKKLDFNRCADYLSDKRWLSPQGIAAIDHANILYNQSLDNGLTGTSLDSVVVQLVNRQEFPDELIQEILTRLSSGSLQLKDQRLLAKGSQTSGNILNIPERSFQALKELLVQKIDDYNQICDINTDKNFKANWEKNLYLLRGWAIIMDKGGNLTSHNHELGWLTGTFYLQMPEQGANTEEGAIEFSHQGPKYPRGSSEFERRVIRPNARNLNIFSSALYHRTLPFQSETQRICIAFDITRKEELWEASN